jgi:cell division protein FtsL
MLRGLIGTILWTCLAGAVGVGLFSVKHEVKEQEQRLSQLNRDIQREQEAIHVLKAEWSYLNDPTRLRALSEKHLGMRPVVPTQVATLDSIARPLAPALAAGEPVVKAPSMTRPEPKPVIQPPAKPQPQSRGTLASAGRGTVVQSPTLAQSERPYPEAR